MFYILIIIFIVYISLMLMIIYHFDKNITIFKAYTPELKVSIIIPFRNEENNICNCIDSVLKQNYNKLNYEIIAIDDHSEDHSLQKLEKYKHNKQIKIISNLKHGKKQALLTGISNSIFDTIITLDADCLAEENWLNSMCNIYETQDCKMLCGPILYQSNKSLFQDLQQAESAAIIGISSTLNNINLPSTCNGANLMFNKNSFLKIGGYHHIEIDSGDDDLLMHDFFKSYLKVVSSLNKDCIVKTNPCKSFLEFKSQRKRWISKAKHYHYSTNNKIQLLVILQNIGFYISLIFSITQPIFLTFVLLKYFTDFIYGMVLRKQLKYQIYTILLMPFYQLYVIYILLSKNRNTKWKNRTINA